MSRRELDRSRIAMRPLAERTNKQQIERDHVAPDAEPRALAPPERALLDELLSRILAARDGGHPVMLTFGAHTIKNGLGPVLIQLMENGWLSHLATNGAGVIHDWEFAFQGKTSEDVAGYVAKGQFGHWEETGKYINLAINAGAYHGMGYGESVGHFIAGGALDLPSPDALVNEIREAAETDPAQAAAAADLLSVMRNRGLEGGRLEVPHAWAAYSAQAAAYRLGIPFTAHPMFGHDIIYNHPMNHGPSIGRAAERDFLCFAESVSRIDGGVYLSVGSSVMSPMVFEKSMSMAQNLASQRNERLERHFVMVVDLARSTWDWSQGEPPQDRPEYYHRYSKTFSRMGGSMRYLCMDNRDFLLHLCRELG